MEPRAPLISAKDNGVDALVMIPNAVRSGEWLAEGRPAADLSA